MGREAGEGERSLPIGTERCVASACRLQMPWPVLVASGLQSSPDVVLEVVHSDSGCPVGTGVLCALHLGGKGLEVRMKQYHSSLPGISLFINQSSSDELYSFQLQVFSPLLVCG